MEAGLRNKFGWDPGRYGGLIGSPDDGDINPTVQIEFVMPSGNRLPELEYDRPIDPTQKRLPPPPPRIHTPFGVLEDRDPPATPEAEMCVILQPVLGGLGEQSKGYSRGPAVAPKRLGGTSMEPPDVNRQLIK